MRALRRQVLDIKPAAQRVEVQSAIALAKRGERVPLEQWRTLSLPDRGRVDMERPGHLSKLKEGAENRMALLDKLPVEFRRLADELGLTVVDAFYRAGIEDARIARRLICLARGEQTDGRPAAFGNRRVGKARS